MAMRNEAVAPHSSKCSPGAEEPHVDKEAVISGFLS